MLGNLPSTAIFLHLFPDLLTTPSICASGPNRNDVSLRERRSDDPTATPAPGPVVGFTDAPVTAPVAPVTAPIAVPCEDDDGNDDDDYDDDDGNDDDYDDDDGDDDDGGDDHISSVAAETGEEGGHAGLRL